MSKVKGFLFLFFALIVIGGGYVYLTIKIETPPRANFSTATNADYYAKPLGENIQCFERTSAVAPISQNTFRLLVWNMHKGQDQGWQTALSEFAEDRDFLLLQEISENMSLPAEISARFSTALYVSAFRYRGELSGVGALTPFIPQTYCVGASTEPWIRIPKVGNAMIFPLENSESLLVINVHLVNFEWYPTYYKRQLEAMLALAAAHRGPIILSGDFNSWNQGRLTFLRETAQQYQLTEATFQPDYRLRFFGHPLDWVFVRGLKVVQATTVETDSSDHNPLLLELKLLTAPQ
ncbi:endonuclease/exonuclease/phosphatase family protein [Caviibacterium pharyngocola]|uniref:Endonuclease/exonuclease/phosphatase domain-containing protein n=1 Tax=Caviibacterium pharyngocola TaxID=28159 RepID=A0A2M8RTQ7_9PAST|nr:endonuclease/exonuclease/phosphatase family protein [Caviibacterium pharyngocola]PJG82244.1 hypothetical protein CVP04_10315 [Caviibacterium pharyngocola]